MPKKLLVTLGPSSLSEEIIRQIEEFGIYPFRINLSHTPFELVATTIDKIQEWTNVPISPTEKVRNYVIQIWSVRV